MSKDDFNQTNPADQFSSIRKGVKALLGWPLLVIPQRWEGKLDPFVWFEACQNVSEDVASNLIGRFVMAESAFEKISPSTNWQAVLHSQCQYVKGILGDDLYSAAPKSVEEFKVMAPQVLDVLREGWMRIDEFLNLPCVQVKSYPGDDPLQNWRGYTLERVTDDLTEFWFPDNSPLLQQGNKGLIRFLQHEYTHLVQDKLKEALLPEAAALMLDILEEKPIAPGQVETSTWDAMVFNTGPVLERLGIPGLSYPSPHHFQKDTLLQRAAERTYLVLPHEKASHASEDILFSAEQSRLAPQQQFVTAP